MKKHNNQQDTQATNASIEKVKNPVGRPRKTPKEKELTKHGRGRAAGETTKKILNLPIGKVRDEKLNAVVDMIREMTVSKTKPNGKFVAKRVLILALIDIALETVPPDVLATRAIAYKEFDEVAHARDVESIKSENEAIIQIANADDFF